MNGAIIHNHFMYSTKFSEQIDLYLEASRKYDCSLDVLSNAEQPLKKYDFVVFLDKDIFLAKQYEMRGIPVYNSSDSIAKCDDKALMYLSLRPFGFPMPKTLIVPLTYSNVCWENIPFVDYAISELSLPLVFKQSKGSFGQQVWLINSKFELIEKLNEYSSSGCILQEYVYSSSGRDIRLEVVGNQVVASMYRWSDTSFKANVSSGGMCKAYEPRKCEIDLAIAVCKALGLSFGGVDILFGENDQPILCEVNSNAHIKNLLQCTGVNVAENIFDYIISDLRKKN